MKANEYKPFSQLWGGGGEELHFLANKNAELTAPPLFWPVNSIKLGGHVALLSDPFVYYFYHHDAPGAPEDR